MSFTVDYTRDFQHNDWIDNVDRVQAGGDNGFNVRFHALERDLDQVSSAVTQIRVALNQLAQTPPAVELRASLIPMMVATGAVGWSHRPGLAEKPAGQAGAAGMMAAILPSGARILGFRAAGRNSGPGDLRISLFRQLVQPGGNPPDRIARVEGPTDPFDVSAVPDPAFQVVDNAQFTYYIVAQLNNAQPADAVVLTGFQIRFATS